MFSFKLNNVIFLLIFHGSDSQRRIKDGTVVTQDKKYVKRAIRAIYNLGPSDSLKEKFKEMNYLTVASQYIFDNLMYVYLLKAQISPRFYEGWVCGGALVSSEYIVTSAACVTDVTHLYAIAGYNKYINETEIYTDPCTKEKKKKIVFICTPKDYELVYSQTEIWSNIDIAMVKVESPYDFTDTSYSQFCSYTPTTIELNFDPKYQEPGIDAIVLGWGHRTSYREEMDLANYNEVMLNYAPTLIQNKEDCKKEYEAYPGMNDVIDHYMICTFDKGNLDDEGGAIIIAEPTAQGCLSDFRSLHGGLSCENAAVPDAQIVLIDNSRKDITPSNFSRNDYDQVSKLNSKINRSVVDFDNTHNSSMINKINKTVLHSQIYNTRRYGICQNDHGGPLVTWVGAHEKLIGVASAYKISETRECIGPYLYTSIQCNGAFIDCILKGDSSNDPSRRDNCKSLLNEQGFKLAEKHISWKDHPDGPADNEKSGTAAASAVHNEKNNVTVKLKNTKEEINKIYQGHNDTKFVNINTNYTTAKHSIIETNITKAVNVGEDSIPMNLITSISTKIDRSVNLTSGNSTNLVNNTTLPNIDTKNTKYQTNSSMNKIENSLTTTLIKKANTNNRNTTNTNFKTKTTTNIYLESTKTNLIKNETQTLINLVDTTSNN